MLLDPSRLGWNLAVKEFIFSLAKTMVSAAIVAGIAYLTAQLSNFHANTPELIMAIALLRALGTSLVKWLGTTDKVVVPSTATVVG